MKKYFNEKTTFSLLYYMSQSIYKLKCETESDDRERKAKKKKTKENKQGFMILMFLFLFIYFFIFLCFYMIYKKRIREIYVPNLYI